jgi:hypothetical protein
MKAKIIDVRPPYIQLETSIGLLTGVCQTDRNIGDSVQIEIDFIDDLIYPANTTRSTVTKHAIASTGDVVTFTGQCEEIDDDGTITLRLASDCIVVAYIDQADWPFRQGDFIKVTLPKHSIEISIQ